jgi:hypothetical protein
MTVGVLGRRLLRITIRFARLRMVDHRVRFTLGSYIRFGRLDFLCMGVDYDLVLLLPSVPVDPASPPGFNECVRDLDPADMEGECVLPTPTRSSNSPADVDSVTELMVGLRLYANKVQASEGTQPHDFNYPRLEHPLDALLGPHPSQEDLHCLYFVFANTLAQLLGGPPLSP